MRSLLCRLAPVFATSLVFALACGGDDAPTYVLADDVGADASSTDADAAPEDVPASDVAVDLTPDVEADVPAPERHPCALLEAEHAGGSCDAPCAPVDCPCESTNLSLVACHETFGCLTAVNCETACEVGLVPSLDCAADYTLCVEDDECPDAGYCMRRDNWAEGECVTGRPGTVCLDNGDCQAGICRASEDSDEGTCVIPAEGDPCATDDDCGGARCDEGACSFAPALTIEWASETEVTFVVTPPAPAGFTDYIGISTHPGGAAQVTAYEDIEICLSSGVLHAAPSIASNCHTVPADGRLTLTSVSPLVGGDGRGAWEANSTTLAAPLHTDGERMGGDGFSGVDLGVLVYRFTPSSPAAILCRSFATCAGGGFCHNFVYNGFGCDSEAIEPAFP